MSERQAVDTDVYAVADEVQKIVDIDGERGRSTGIFSMADKLNAAGFDGARFVGSTDLGLHYVEIPVGANRRIVVISKEMIEPDGDTQIIGPYAIGIMG